jgi:hypothetical protein
MARNPRIEFLGAFYHTREKRQGLTTYS